METSKQDQLLDIKKQLFRIIFHEVPDYYDYKLEDKIITADHDGVNINYSQLPEDSYPDRDVLLDLREAAKYHLFAYNKDNDFSDRIRVYKKKLDSMNKIHHEFYNINLYEPSTDEE
jgi:hypothetical protein